jgi:hypothetical protein
MVGKGRAHAGDGGSARPAREIEDREARRCARAPDADDGDLDRAVQFVVLGSPER